MIALGWAVLRWLPKRCVLLLQYEFPLIASTIALEEVSLIKKNYTPWPESASELYRPSDRRLSAKLVPTFADRGCHVVRRTLGFLDRMRNLWRQLYIRIVFSPVHTFKKQRHFWKIADHSAHKWSLIEVVSEYKVGGWEIGYCSTVRGALCYKPEGHGFDTRWCDIFLTLPSPSGRTRPWGLLSL
jgi:hypothetical protein